MYSIGICLVFSFCSLFMLFKLLSGRRKIAIQMLQWMDAYHFQLMKEMKNMEIPIETISTMFMIFMKMFSISFEF